MAPTADRIAEIYRHSSEFLSVPEFQHQAQAVLDAVASPGTLANLSQDLAPGEILLRLTREFWSQGMKQGG